MRVLEAFWAKVDKSAGPDGCWLWTGRLSKGGYGIVFLRYVMGAHRIAWTLTNGPIPSGMFIRHTCDNPPCCNPAHLLVGTHQDNMADMAARRRHAYQDGEANPRARLTAAQVALIRQRRSDGLTHLELAREYGVSPKTIGKLLRRESWSHL